MYESSCNLTLEKLRCLKAGACLFHSLLTDTSSLLCYTTTPPSRVLSSAFCLFPFINLDSNFGCDLQCALPPPPTPCHAQPPSFSPVHSPAPAPLPNLPIVLRLALQARILAAALREGSGVGGRMKGVQHGDAVTQLYLRARHNCHHWLFSSNSLLFSMIYVVVCSR